MPKNYGHGIPNYSALVERFQADVNHYGGTLPERVQVAWLGYFAALHEWDLISDEDFERLKSRISGHLHCLIELLK